MARPPSEKLTLQGDHYKIRLHHADGTRPWFHFAPGMSEARCLGLLPKLRDLAKNGKLVRADDAPVARNSSGVGVAKPASNWAPIEPPFADGETYVYFVRDPGKNVLKIGISKDVRGRIQRLQTACSNRLELMAMCAGNRFDEDAIHGRLSAHRLEGEWFEMADRVVRVLECARAHQTCVSLLAAMGWQNV